MNFILLQYSLNNNNNNHYLLFDLEQISIRLGDAYKYERISLF